MRVLILEAARSDKLNEATIASYVSVARMHGDLELWILVRQGVAALPGVEAVRGEIRMLEEVADFYARGLVERRVISLLETEKFDLLFAPREGDIIRAARLREKYAIAGQGVASAIAYRDKLHMKKTLADAAIATWPSCPVDDAVDYWDAIQKVGIPAVLKPRLEFGTENVLFIHDDANAQRAAVRCFARLPVDVPAHYVLESFSDNPMCHVDGIWHNGKSYYTIASAYYGFADGRPLAENLGRACGSLMIDPVSERGRRLISFVHDSIRALPSDHTFPFHAEVWESADGSLFMNEIAARMGGSLVHSNAVAATGAEPDAVWLALLAGVDPHSIGYVGKDRIRPCAGVGLPYRPGCVASVSDSCDLDSVLELELWPSVLPGSTLPPQRNWFDNLGIATITASDYAKLPAEIDRVVTWALRSIEIVPAA